MNDTLTNYIKAAITNSPTAFHATHFIKNELLKASYTQLSESEHWGNLTSGRYFVTRNDSSIVAFSINKDSKSTGYAIVGTHTDSPSLKVKPKPKIQKNGYCQIGVEIYGSVLYGPLFDRDLSLAGRITYLDVNHGIQSALVNFDKPIGVIPSLAIHLDREVNNHNRVNPQVHLLPVLSQIDFEFDSICHDQLLRHGICDAKSILDFELFFYDSQKPNTVGLFDEFITSARLDNLLSCFVGLSALLDSQNSRPSMLVCTDHEEVGSNSYCGADSLFLSSIFQRIFPDQSDLQKCIYHSMLLSVDNAHGIHPNYPDKHDSNHGPMLNNGPVIKINANQRYATNSLTSGLVKAIASKLSIPLQHFVIRADMACGSTIGPLIASNLGIKTVDIGVPTFAMHSIREMAGVKDIEYLKALLLGFYTQSRAFI